METQDNKTEDLHQAHREHLKEMYENMHQDSKTGRVMGGLIILGVGVALLLKQMGIIILPDWVFKWPVLLILIGLYVGARHNFRVGGWPIMILVGGVFLAQNFYPNFNISEYIWPIIIIGIGALMILPRQRRRWNYWAEKQYWRHQKHSWKAHHHGSGDWKHHREQWRANHGAGPGGIPGAVSSEDYIDSVSFFGQVHKVISSKEFRGGDVVNIFGGCEIDLTQADIKGKITLDVVQIFGGTKIIVPADWEIQSKMVAVFGGTEDKRNPALIKANPEKILVIEGTSIFAGVQIISY